MNSLYQMCGVMKYFWSFIVTEKASLYQQKQFGPTSIT